MKIVTLLLSLFLALPLGAQSIQSTTGDSSSASRARHFKSPHRARVLGTLIPGAGHIYAGEFWKGVRTYEGTVGMFGMGTMVAVLGKCGFNWECKSGGAGEIPYYLLGAVGVGVGISEWISSARDAPHAAERANARHQSREVTPVVNLFSGSHKTSELGVSLRF